MDLIQLTKDGFKLIKRLQPYLENADTTLKTIVSIGGSAGMLLQQGRQLYTYLFGTRQEKPGAEKATDEIAFKEDIAILVDINQRTLLSVGRYLQAQQIDANMIVVTNDAAYSEQPRLLNVENPEEWTEIVKEFYRAILAVRRYVGPVRWHFFLATPLPLAFGLGSVFATVDNATAYHWQNGTYHPVVHISRKLREDRQ